MPQKMKRKKRVRSRLVLALSTSRALLRLLQGLSLTPDIVEANRPPAHVRCRRSDHRDRSRALAQERGIFPVLDLDPLGDDIGRDLEAEALISGQSSRITEGEEEVMLDIRVDSVTEALEPSEEDILDIIPAIIAILGAMNIVEAIVDPYLPKGGTWKSTN